MPNKPLTFICGDDDYLVSEEGRAWFTAQTEGLADDLSKEVVDGRAANVSEVEDALQRFTSAVQTLSLFGDRKVVWLKDVNFMADSVTGRAQGTLDLLEVLKTTLEGLDPEAVGVLITAYPVDKRRSFYKWVSKMADFKAMDAGRDAAHMCAELVRTNCAKSGIEIEAGAVEVLVAKVNGNTRLLVEECRKLCTYVGDGGGPITEREVMELVPNFGEADFFEAADAFFSLDLEWTLQALRRHFFTNNDARGLLGSLQSRNRLLIQLRVLLDAGAIRLSSRGLSKQDLEGAAKIYASHFGDVEEKSNLNVFSQNPFYLGRMAGTVGKAPLKRWIDFQLAFAEAFEAIIQRPKEQEEVCRELAVKCLS
ncbi:MAG: DNA polymerase III subunit delta [Opitutales bacterium]